MSISVKVNGAYKEMSDCKVKVAGAWKQAAAVYTKVNGVWKEVWTNLAVDMVLEYGVITELPLKTSGLYIRLYGVSITIKRKSDGAVLQTITEEDTGTMLSKTYSLKDGGSLSISSNDNRNGLEFEFWQSGSVAEVKIRKAILTNESD